MRDSLGNFGYTPMVMRKRGMGDFSNPGRVLPISDFKGFKAQATLGSWLSDITGVNIEVDPNQVAADAQAALAPLIDQTASQIMNNPQLTAMGKAKALASTVTVQQVLVYGGIAAVLLIVASTLIGRGTVGSRAAHA